MIIQCNRWYQPLLRKKVMFDFYENNDQKMASKDGSNISIFSLSRREESSKHKLSDCLLACVSAPH